MTDQPNPTDDSGTVRTGTDGSTPDRPEPLVEEDLLVEDVSIDGMCGVY